jgi:hypothetical protein
MKRTALIAAVAAGLVALACGGSTPTAVDQPAPVAITQEGGTVTASAGVVKAAISGTLDMLWDHPGNQLPPGRVLINPDGKFHYWDGDVYDIFAGDVAGPVVFHEKGVVTPDRHYIGSGPFDAEVTWNGRYGTISGQWTTNCEPDPSRIYGWSCGGTMNARGAGGLEGVQFHFNWGPGFYPFPYTGTVFYK